MILCGGAINSPQLLKLSGVGPEAELRALGIPIVHALPGVGENLQDHLEFYFQVASKQPITLYAKTGLLRRALIGAHWLMRDHGDGATNHFEAGGFIRSRAGIPHPDIQYHFLPMAVSYDGANLAAEHGYQAHVGPLRSKSRGWVRLKSADPREPPRIQFNYMSVSDDWLEMRACVRLTREIFGQAAFDPYRGREIQPGADCLSDEAIDAFVREKIESAYHPCGTCKMGAPDDPLGGRRRPCARDRARGLARRRRFDHALDHLGQSQRSDDHDRGKSFRHHPRPRPARRLQRAVLCRAGLAGEAEVRGIRVGFGTARSIVRMTSGGKSDINALLSKRGYDDVVGRWRDRLDGLRTGGTSSREGFRTRGRQRDPNSRGHTRSGRRTWILARGNPGKLSGFVAGHDSAAAFVRRVAPETSRLVRILFDQNLPHKLRTSLLDRSSHEISTAAYKGWSALKNGDLLRAAERDGFDVFVTGDTTLVLEQNLTSRRLAIVTLSTNNWPIIKDKVPEILGAINLATPGSFVTVECGRFSRKR